MLWRAVAATGMLSIFQEEKNREDNTNKKGAEYFYSAPFSK